VLNFLKKLVIRIGDFSRNKSIWSFTDQGIISLGNFCTNILLARNLPQADYGSYLLIYGALIFLTGTHAALIVYPLSVKGAVADSSELRRLSVHYLLFTTLLTFVSSALVFGVTVAVGKSYVAPIAIIALLFWEIQETVRRALMSHLRHQEATWGDGLSYIGQAVLVWLLAQKGWLSMESAFFVIALTSAVAAALQMFQLQLKNINLEGIWKTAKDGWNLGKWNLIGNLTTVINIHATPWVLAIFHGKEATAAVQAVINILGASNPVIFSINNLMVPSIAKANLEGGMKSVNRVTFKYALQGGLILFPLYLSLALFPRKILELMYGINSPYLNLDNVLRLYVLAYTILYLSQIPSAILAGLEKSKSAFMGQIGTVASALFIGIPLIITMSTTGAAISSIFSNIARILINSLQVQKLQISRNKNNQFSG
jgi:O-antigen/teichoic acid export membrane protein